MKITEIERADSWAAFTHRQRTGWRGWALVLCAVAVVPLVLLRAPALWYAAPMVYLWGQIALGAPRPGHRRHAR